MDDLKQVREMYGEPPLDPFAKTRVAARMKQQRGSRRPWKLGLAVLAVATAAVVVAPGLLPAEPGKAPTVLGQPVLLAAAAQAEKAPEGTYWHVKRKYTMRWAKEHGKAGSRYRIETANISERWTDREGKGWSGLVTLPTRPLDEAAWKRNGSPTTWNGVHTTEQGKPRLHKVKGPAKFYLAEGEISFAELQELPTDPDQLTSWLSERIATERESTLEIDVAQPLVSLLYEVPATPDVRAAAYRALAEQPGVRVTEGVKDPAGRTGVAIEYQLQKDQPTQVRVVIDPETSMVLAHLVTGMPGKGDRIESVLDSGWTDEEPAPPTVE